MVLIVIVGRRDVSEVSETCQSKNKWTFSCVCELSHALRLWDNSPSQ